MKANKRISYIIAALFVVISAAYSPMGKVSAYSHITGAGEDLVKKFLYGNILYNCFNNAADSLLGDKDDGLRYDHGVRFANNILKAGDTQHQDDFLQLLDNKTGVSCNDAINALLGENVEITESMLDEGGILYNAYGKEGSSDVALQCKFNRYNKGNDFENGENINNVHLVTEGGNLVWYDLYDAFLNSHFSSEYTEEFLREHLDNRRYDQYHEAYLDRFHSIGTENIAVWKYGEDGEFYSIYFPYTGNEVTIDQYWEYPSFERFNLSMGKKVKEELYSSLAATGTSSVCASTIIPSLKSARWNDYLDKNENPGDYYLDVSEEWDNGIIIASSGCGAPVCATDNPIFGKRPFGIAEDTIKDDVKQAENGGIMYRMEGAAQQIAKNIKDLYFGGKDPQSYFKTLSDREINYVLEGRYLYNGDGKFPKGCGGISVKADDTRIQELNDNTSVFWNLSSAYVVEAYAYESPSQIMKKYRTKIGALDAKSEGKDNSVILFEGNGSVKCSELATAFNNVTTNISTPSNYTKAIEQVYGYINPMPISYIIGEASEPVDPPEDPTDPPEDPEDPPYVPPTTQDKDAACYDKAGSLGWILCPMIVGLQDVILETYAKWITPALQVDARLFHAGNEANDGTYKAWGVFRTIANFIFIILLIFTIFSQITGFGIEKYGIKRMIPKLLIVALLINLSFIICQVAIDIGNIVGNGIGGLFKSISNSISIPSTIQVEGQNVGSLAWESFISDGWNVAIVVIVAILGVAAVLTQGLAIIIPVLLTLLSVFISIITLIAILGIRQALIVLLVVASPIAFACYAFPNTKSVFDRWFNAFKTALVAFPVCSAMIYGGNMASMILLKTANGNTWLLIAAAVIGIAPIFMIPKVIKACMGAISLGMARMGGKVGSKAKGAAGKRLDNSFLTRRRNYNQQMRNQKAAMRSSAYNAKRGKKVMNRYNNDPSKLNRFQKQKYFAARGAVNANNAEMESAYSSDYANQTDGQIIGALNAAAKNGDLNSNMLVSGLKNIKNERQLVNTLRSLSGTKAYQDLMKNDPTVRERISSSMRGRDGVISQSIGKVMNSKTGDSYNTDVDKMFRDGSLKAEVQRAGAGVMANQSHEVFDTEGAADLFSDEQLREASISGYSGATAASFHEMMTGKVSESRKANIISGLTAANATKLRVEKDESGNNIGSFHALGGASLINKYNPSLATTLNSSAGDKLRGDMQTEVKNELGVKHD